MNRGIQIVLLFSVMFGFSNCKKAENDIIYSKKYLNEIKQVRSQIGIFFTSNLVPGGSFAISKNGELIYSESFGLASKDLEVSASRETKFRVGTLSQLFTSAIYLKMIEEGKLHPDSTVQYYYPGFPTKAYPIHLQHLAQHTSGIREPNYKEQTRQALNVSIEKGLETFKNDALITPPGAYQNANNFNYNLLAAVMEKATKKHYKQLLETYLTDTLHLTNTVIDNPVLTIKNRSNFFDLNFISQVTNANPLDLRYQAASVGILSNSEDLVKFGQALLYSDYFSETLKKQLFEKAKLINGLEANMSHGWNIFTDPRGYLVYGLDGSVTGGSASLLIYPDEELIIACTTNLTSATSNFPIFKIVNLFLPQTEEQEQQHE